MSKYKEISHKDFLALNDRSGYYHVQYNPGSFYAKNGEFHREEGAAIISNNWTEYYLYGCYYGDNNDFTDETWKVFAKRKIKLKAFE